MAANLGADSNMIGFDKQPLRDHEFPWLVGNADCINAELGRTAQYDIMAGISVAIAITENKANSRPPVYGDKR